MRNLGYLARHNRVVEWWTFLVWAVRRSGAFRGSRLRFIGRELWGRRGREATYRRPAGGLEVLLRHRSRDAAVVEEVFIRDWYRPPDEVMEAVAGLGAEPSVVGLGGHIGLFGLRARELWPQSRVTEFEPDPTSAALLRRNIEANGLGDRWGVIEALAAAEDGVRGFGAGRSSISTAAAGTAGPGSGRVRAADVFPHLEAADLIKMDIEGGEWEILGDRRFAALSARAVVLEHHPQHCPDPHPQAHARRLLESAGYTVRPLWCKPNEVGMMWAWRER